jgi:hypothetical protein
MSLTKATFSMIEGAPVNVLDYGAVGDGVADDTAAGTAAIATGRPVYWPTGTYKVSPITTPLSGSEPNRTSAWVLANDQIMFGDGPGSILLWGTPGTQQCFFKAANCTNVGLKNLRFDGGYSSIVVDPTADGSVDGVTVENCYFDNLLIDVLGGNQLALDDQSKYGKNIFVRSCFSSGPAVHSILFTNCYNAQATGNSFNNVTGGFCIDASQGSRNVVVANNTADTCKYFCKVESTNIPPAVAANSASHEVVISGNTAINIDEYGIFINNAADHISIVGNIMVGFTDYGIYLSQSIAYTHNGSLAVSANILSADPVSTTAIGIYDDMGSNGTNPHVFANNVIDEVLTGIRISRKTAVITGGSIDCTGSCVLLDVAFVLDGIIVSGVKMKGATGVNADGVGQPITRLTITGNQIAFTAAGIVTDATTYQSVFNDNSMTSSAPTIGGIVLTSPTNSSIQNNLINMSSASIDAITNATVMNDCIVTGNVTTRPITITNPSPGVISTGNISNATYYA